MKKILIVSDMPTHPVNGGNRMCILQNASLLRTMGYEVHFLFIDTYYASDEERAEIEQYWAPNYHYFATNRAQYVFRKICGRLRLKCITGSVDFDYPWGLARYVDALHAKYHFSGMLINYVWLSKLSNCKVPNQALYTHDVFTYCNERVKSSYHWHSFTIAEEAKGIRRMENILAIQEHEAILYSYMAPTKNVQAVFSPVDFVRQPTAGNQNILFFSGGGYLNLSGIEDFITNVWPKLLQLHPQAQLLIGGGICKSLDNRELPSNIQLMGRFDNPDDFYALGDIAINPVFKGTGLKIKTIEALAHGKYLVVHPHSAEGMFRAPYLPLDIAHSSEEFCMALEKALMHPEIIVTRQKDCERYIAEMNEHIHNVYKSIYGDVDY